MTISESLQVASPCIGVCQMDNMAGVCAGCLRTRDEIAAWSTMQNEQKQRLLQVLEQRQQKQLQFD